MKLKKSKTHRQFVKWLEDRISLYRHLMALNPWAVYVNQKMTVFESDAIILNTTVSEDGYLKADLNWGKTVFGYFCDKDFDQLERAVIHELGHLLLRDLWSINRKRYTTLTEWGDNEEKICDHIAHVIHRIMKGWKPDGL